MTTIPKSPPIDAFTDNARLGAEVIGLAEVDALVGELLVGAVLVGTVLVGTVGVPDEVAEVDTVDTSDVVEPELPVGKVLTLEPEPELVLDQK